MIRNYFKIAWRNLLRNKTFSFINIAGLAAGLCCFLLIALYVLDELSYDRFNKKADRIYRINMDARMAGVELHLPEAPDAMGGLLKKDYAEVEDYARIFNNSGSRLVKKGNSYITEAQVAYVDPSFFNLFTFPALDGDPGLALENPDAVVISASTAKKYFGNVNVAGKTLEIMENNQPAAYRVGAVIKDMPENAHFRFDLLFSMKKLQYGWGNVGNHTFYTYLLLRPGVNYKAFEKKFPGYIQRYLFPELAKVSNVKSWDEFVKAGNAASYSLTPLTRIHLYSDRLEELRPPGSIQYVYIFSAVAVFILLIACVNFMNLTTAKSAGRAKEIGIRKTLGTRRKELVLQFFTESTLMVILSFLLALVMAYALLPLFNNMAGKEMRLQHFLSPYVLPLLIALPFAVGLLAGSYPAVFLSGFRPVAALKGRFRAGKGRSLRGALVVFQFATSIVLIMGTLIVYRQLYYIQHRNPGFNREQVLIVDGANALGNNIDAFRNEVLRLSGVKSGTISSFLPVSGSQRSANLISKNAVVSAGSVTNMQNWYVDYDYLPTLGLELLEGRNFSREHGTDADAVIINETAAKILGYDHPVGQKLYTSNSDNSTAPHTIIGVVKNFNYESLRHEVGPLVFYPYKSTGLAAFRISPGNPGRLIADVKRKWESMATGMPFSYRFMDESFNAMYRAEQQAGQIALVFSVLAILIACLGIFGLAAFVAEERMKEIGIRKVLGASVSGIVKMLSADFMKLVALSFVVAAPAGWWLMQRWLQGFAFRTNISWWILPAAGAAALLVALLTVSFQSVKAALMNPLRTLSNE